MKQFKVVTFIILIFTIFPSFIYSAYFDTHSSKNNYFSATTLDTKLEGVPSNIVLVPDSDFPVVLTLTNIGELSTSNVGSIEFVSGDKDLFDMLNIDIPNPGDLTSGESESFSYLFSMKSEDYELSGGKSVKVNVVISSFSVGETSGFNDVEKFEVTITNDSISESINE